MDDSDKSLIRSLLDRADRASLAADEDTELALRKQLVDLDPTNPRSLMQYGNCCLMHSRLSEVQETIEALKALPKSRSLYRLMKVDFLVDTEAYEQLSDLFSEWSQMDPLSVADSVSLLVRAWQHTGKDIYFQHLAELCLKSKNQFFIDAISLYFHIKSPTDIRWTNKDVSPNPMELFWFVNFVEALIDHGYYETALQTAIPFRASLAAAPNGDPDLLRALDETITIGEYLLDHQTRPHELIEEDYSKDVLISSPRKKGKVAFIFTGLNGRAMVGNRILDFYLAQLGYQTVFLRDAERYAFGKGVKSIGETRQDTIRFMKAFCEKQNCSDPLIIGTSIGTFGAISHGLPIGASRFVLFGPVTVAGDKKSLMSLGDVRLPSVLIRCQKGIPEGERKMSDYIAPGTDTANIKIVFNEFDDLDRRFAESLQDFPNVTLVEIQDAGSHNALRSTLAQGRFNSLLA